jgi:hydrogenase maturation protease
MGAESELPGQRVIGIGNPLRGDDGVGALLAEEAGGCHVQQLTPELAAELAPLQRVLFIDAWLAPPGAAPRLDRLDPLLPGDAHGAAGLASHRLDPAQLLALCQALYGRAPEGWWLRIPAWALAHGTTFSPALTASLPAARALRQTWLAHHA